MIEMAARIGYPQVSVASVSARAGMSTASFYECFGNIEDLLVASCRTAAARLLGNRPAETAGSTPDALRATLEPLLVAWQEDPAAGQILFVQTLAGGARARRTRARALAAFERSLERSLDGGDGATSRIDLPAAALTGALCGFAAGDPLEPLALLEDLLDWVDAYAVAAAAPRASVGSAILLPCAPASARRPRPDACWRPTQRLPRGRHGIPRTTVTRMHRARIIHGVAEVVSTKGYADATVADFVAAAGIARQVFYEHFANKADAFAAAQQYGSVEIRRVCSRAYFAPERWPERMSALLSAAAGLIAANRALAHLRLVDCYPAGPAAIERAERLRADMETFIYEGFGYGPPAAAPPERCADAIAGALFELIRRDLARGDAITMLPRRVPQLTFIAIAPFTGPSAAAALAGEHARRGGSRR